MSIPRWFTPALAASLFVVASPTQPRAYAQTDARGHSLAPRQEPEPGDTAAALAARVARATAACELLTVLVPT